MLAIKVTVFHTVYKHSGVHVNTQWIITPLILAAVTICDKAKSDTSNEVDTTIKII